MYKKNVLWTFFFYCGAKNASAIAPGPAWVPIAAPTETIGNSSFVCAFSQSIRLSSIYLQINLSESPVYPK